MFRHRDAVETWGRRGLAAAVADGRLRRIGRGWYAQPTDATVVTALRRGGYVGCLSAARLHDLWTPPDTDVHVLLRRRSGVGSEGVVLHPVREWPAEVPVVGVRDALRQVLRHHDAETGLIVVESALNQRLIRPGEVAELATGLAQRTHRVLESAITLAQSGTETRVRHFFWRRGVPVQPQAFVPGVGRVDLLVGRSWIIECDSRAWHTGEERYTADRDRDIAVAGRRFRVTRLTHGHVFTTWEITQQRLSEALQRRWHRLEPT